MNNSVRAAMLVASIAALAPAAVTAGELDAVIRALPGTQAAFTQKFVPKGFTRPQIERGDVIFGSLPSMRWSYSGAEPRLFVFDGRQSWLFTPAEKQVELSVIDASEQRTLPFAFLWDASALRDYKVSERRAGSETVVALQPLSAEAQFRDVTMRVDPRTHLIRRVDYSDRAGNRTSFEFASPRKVTPPASTFRFDIPPGVRVLRK